MPQTIDLAIRLLLAAAAPRVATANACVSPRVKSAEPCARGSRPALLLIGRTAVVALQQMAAQRNTSSMICDKQTVLPGCYVAAPDAAGAAAEAQRPGGTAESAAAPLDPSALAHATVRDAEVQTPAGNSSSASHGQGNTRLPSARRLSSTISDRMICDSTRCANMTPAQCQGFGTQVQTSHVIFHVSAKAVHCWHVAPVSRVQRRRVPGVHDLLRRTKGAVNAQTAGCTFNAWLTERTATAASSGMSSLSESDAAGRLAASRTAFAVLLLSPSLLAISSTAVHMNKSAGWKHLRNHSSNDMRDDGFCQPAVSACAIGAGSKLCTLFPAASQHWLTIRIPSCPW